MRVYVPITGWITYTVDTVDEEEAKNAVFRGEADFYGLDGWNENLDSNTWEVESD